MFVLGLTPLTSGLCGACESVFCLSLSAGDSKLVIPPPVERSLDDWRADGEKSGKKSGSLPLSHKERDIKSILVLYFPKEYLMT